MPTTRTWKQRLYGVLGLVCMVLGALLVLGGVIVLFSSVSAGFSILLPGLVVAGVGAQLRGHARGDAARV